jgi:hypothetical protein
VAPTASPAPHDPAAADRVAALVHEFLGDSGFDDGPVDPDAASRFMEETEPAWQAYLARES